MGMGMGTDPGQTRQSWCLVRGAVTPEQAPWFNQGWEQTNRQRWFSHVSKAGTASHRERPAGTRDLSPNCPTTKAYQDPKQLRHPDFTNTRVMRALCPLSLREHITSSVTNATPFQHGTHLPTGNRQLKRGASGLVQGAGAPAGRRWRADSCVVWEQYHHALTGCPAVRLACTSDAHFHTRLRRLRIGQHLAWAYHFGYTGGGMLNSGAATRTPRSSSRQPQAQSTVSDAPESITWNIRAAQASPPWSLLPSGGRTAALMPQQVPPSPMVLPPAGPRCDDLTMTSDDGHLPSHQLSDG